MSKSTVRGECLCGAVKLSAPNMDGVLGACHCDICRKWSGGALLAVNCGSELVIDGEDALTLFRSSERAERGFCSVCGTHLFMRVTHDGRYLVPPGLLEGNPDIRFDHQIFIDKKPGYYSFANETAELTSKDIFGEGPS